MKTRADPKTPKPWRERERDELGALFRGVAHPKPLERAALAEVRLRLARRHGHRRSRARELLPILAALLSGAGVAFGGVSALEWARSPAPPSVAPSTSSSVSARPARQPPREVPRRELAQARLPEAAPAITPSGARVSRPTSSPSTLSRESEALARALAALRRDRDPRAALALLDAYAAEFPDGTLALEARVARVDAWIALGDRRAALALLRGLPLERMGRSAELRLLRAELASEESCAAALPDLDLLVGGSPPALHERALHARAACRLRIGDRAGALADLGNYLDGYPNGRFAADVRLKLAELGSR